MGQETRYRINFKRAAVRLTLTSGQPRAETADDLGIDQITDRKPPVLARIPELAYIDLGLEALTRFPASLFRPKVSEVVEQALQTPSQGRRLPALQRCGRRFG
jgi:hypothetical protein